MLAQIWKYTLLKGNLYLGDEMLEVLGIVTILVISGILIYYYGKVVQLYFNGEDILKVQLLPYTDIDIWSISHFILFVILGYNFPSYIPLFIVFGAAWEGIEELTGNPKVRKIFLGETIDPKGDVFWYSKISDILVDVVGLIVGYVMSQTV